MLSSVLLFGFILSQQFNEPVAGCVSMLSQRLGQRANLCDNMQTHPVTDLLSGRTRCRKSLSKRAVCSFAFGKSRRASAEIRAHDAQAWPCSIASCRAVCSVVFSWRFTFARFSMKSCSMSELPCAAALWSNGSTFSFSTRSTDSTSFFANSNVFLHPSSSQYGLALGACNLVGPGQMRLIVRKLAT